MFEVGLSPEGPLTQKAEGSLEWLEHGSLYPDRGCRDRLLGKQIPMVRSLRRLTLAVTGLVLTAPAAREDSNDSPATVPARLTPRNDSFLRDRLGAPRCTGQQAILLLNACNSKAASDFFRALARAFYVSRLGVEL